MVKRMLIDAAHKEETRVSVVDGNRLEDFDFESKIKKQIKGNIYLAKVTRVEPSLQACFVEYGGNRQGFLAFSEIHPDYYRIPVEDREALLEEERRLAELEEEEAEIEDAKHENNRRAEQSSGDDLIDDDSSDKESEKTESSSDPISDDDGDDIMLAENEDKDEKVVQDVDGNADDKDAPKKKRTPRKPRKASTKTKKTEDAETVEGDNKEDKAVGEEAQPIEEKQTEALQDNGTNDDNGEETADKSQDKSESGKNNRRRSKPSLRKRYKIQEVITRRQIMLVQVTKEERGNKGAALTTYISLPGRYCVLMPNSPRGGGISRKISNPKDRRRMREIIRELEVPQGMSVILRTAGLQRKSSEIKRDLDYLLRMWDTIRQSTLESIAPSLIYEEGDLAKRAIRDLYSADVDEILVNEEEAYRNVKDFMKMLVPSHARKVKLYKEETFPLFHRYQVESQIEEIYKPEVRLKSGGYIVINPTEALVSIDVNSGKSTRERNIDETALKTNLEAAEEVARQLRLRDLGGLVVVDFIDMENYRHNMKVERKMREAMANDRARVEVGRLSQFGLLELSRQRLRPSFSETHFEICPYCNGTGMVRTIESASVTVLRELEEEGIRNRADVISVTVPPKVALYLLNQKREKLSSCELRYGVTVFVRADEKMARNDFIVEPTKARDKSVVKDKVVSSDIDDAVEATIEELPEEQAENDNVSDDTDKSEEKRDDGDNTAQDEKSSSKRRNNNRRRRSQYRSNRRNNRRDNPSEEHAERSQQKTEQNKAYNTPQSSEVKTPQKAEPVSEKPANAEQPVKKEQPAKPFVVGSDAGVQSVNQRPDQPKKGWWKKLVE